MRRWFYKVTNPIPVQMEANDFGYIDGVHYRTRTVQAGLSICDGRVFINYSFLPMWHPFFWDIHVHEFLHRIFWLLKWEKIDKIMDRINRAVFTPSIVKKVRKRGCIVYITE